MKEIRNPIDHLPRSGGKQGSPPSSNPFAVESLADAWHAQYVADGRDVKGLAIPEAGPYRGSMTASRCDRQLYYGLTDTERSNPPTIADQWRFFLGQIVHEHIQPAVLDTFEGGAEAKHDLRVIGIPGSAHSDLSLRLDVGDERCLVEVKSVNGFKFKMMATRFNGPPEGPSYGHVLQAAMAAKAEGIDKIVLLYISLELLSPSMAKSYTDTEVGRFMAEWHYTVSELEPQIEAEIDRINRIVKYAERGILPATELHDPEFPKGAIVTEPKRQPKATWQSIVDGYVTDAGEYWGCNYCSWQDRCANEPDDQADNLPEPEEF